MQIFGIDAVVVKRFQIFLFPLSCSVGLIPSGYFPSGTKMQSSVDSDLGTYAKLAKSWNLGFQNG